MPSLGMVAVERVTAQTLQQLLMLQLYRSYNRFTCVRPLSAHGTFKIGYYGRFAPQGNGSEA